ncbi:MAG: tRNA pseudouridine(55) synthase TruB [Treponema sp.]|jgi:tRNA pseudouridine55 synthase|nr:tRNA pseudouridine(55) synthase TruB [Treponema sp.]
MGISKTGYLLLNKKPGYSSFESLFAVKKAFGTGKVCHTGTLDKFAAGLLVVLVGRAVKLSPWFSGCDKRYSGRIKIGEETDTLDPEGKVVAESAPCSREAFESALAAFRGEILQAPPEYSALHINGIRAHLLARQGLGPKMEKRPVTIYSLNLVSWEPPFAGIDVHCSKGTYIRSLARDIALAAGTRAHLSALTRTAVGGFLLEDAVSPPDAGRLEDGQMEDGQVEDGREARLERLEKALAPLDRELFRRLNIPSLEIGEKEAAAVSHGGSLRFLEERAVPSTVLALFHGASLAAVTEKKDGVWGYGYVAGM